MEVTRFLLIFYGSDYSTALVIAARYELALVFFAQKLTLDYVQAEA